MHVITKDGRHVQVALYGWAVREVGRQTATWESAVYADTEEPLTRSDEEQWRDDLVAAAVSRVRD